MAFFKTQFFNISFISSKPETPYLSFYLPPKLVFRKNSNHSIPESLHMLISKNLLHIFARKIFKNYFFSSFAETFIAYITLPVHGRIQEFLRENDIFSCYQLHTDATMVGGKVERQFVVNIKILKKLKSSCKIIRRRLKSKNILQGYFHQILLKITPSVLLKNFRPSFMKLDIHNF